MDKTLDLLIKYSQEGKIVDKDFMREIAKTQIYDKSLEQYIKKIYFSRILNYSKNYPKLMGAYIYYFKIIIMDERLLSLAYNAIRKRLTGENFTGNIISNTMILHYFLHEIEHANQYKKSLAPNETLENLLLAICFHVDNEIMKKVGPIEYLLSNLNKKAYSEKKIYEDETQMNKLESTYASCVIYERLADILSLQEVLDIIKPLEMEEANQYLKAELTTYLRRGYEEGVSPVEKYLLDFKKLNIIGSEKYFEEGFSEVVNDCRDYSFEQRLTLGLPLTKKEFSHLERV